MAVIQNIKTRLSSILNNVYSVNILSSSVVPPYYLEVSKGNLTDLNASKFGLNKDIDKASGNEIIAVFGGAWSMPTAGVATFVSSSANDTSAGTGARTLLIEGVDSSGNLASETISTNGTTNVITATSWRGINSVKVETAGTLELNEGTITGTISGTTQAQIEAGVSIANQLLYFVPDDYDCFIKKIQLEVDRSMGGAVRKVTFLFKELSGGVNYTPFQTELDTSLNSKFSENFVVPLKLSAGSVWYLTASTDTNNTFVRGRVEQIISPI